MKRKTSEKVTLAIRKILEEKRRGVRVMLLSGCKVWLPKNKVNFRTDDYNGQQIVEIPGWLKKRVDEDCRKQENGYY